MCIESTCINLQPRRKTNLLYRYGYVLLMLICMIFASIQPNIGGTNGKSSILNIPIKKRNMCVYTHLERAFTYNIFTYIKE